MQYFDTGLIDSEDMTLSEGHGNAGKLRLLHQLSHTVFNRFGWDLSDC